MPLPEGFGLVLDPSVRVFDGPSGGAPGGGEPTGEGGKVLVGGWPGRLLTLSEEGSGCLDRLLRGGAVPEAALQLGRRLVDAGMAHPRPVTPVTPAEVARRVSVVIPARDRADRLAACLASVRRTEEGAGVPIVVVDDASADPTAIEEACTRFDARLLVRAVNGGPGAARNEALPAVDADVLVFLDSDCTVRGEWIAPLLAHFEDPAVGAVAPRIRPFGDGADRPGVLARFAASHSDLDMGRREAAVGPGRPVRYVPAAALLVRRAALESAFDPALRVGEDVDLVWRLGEEGWSVRYVPAVEVEHGEPGSWTEWLRRRFRYGTSAGPLARRHPGRLAPVELRPWPTFAALALLAGRPVAALAAVGTSSVQLARRTRGHGLPPLLPLRWSAESAGWTVVGIGHATSMLAVPVLAFVTVRNRRGARRLLTLVLVPPIVEWWRRRPALDPVRWTLASLADDLAYGAGVWVGCVRSGAVGPLLPSLLLQPAGRTGGVAEPTGRAGSDATSSGK